MQRRDELSKLASIVVPVLALVVCAPISGCNRSECTQPRAPRCSSDVPALGPHRLDIEPLPVGLQAAFVRALAVLAATAGSGFSESNVALQKAPNASQRFAVLLAEERGIGKADPGIVPKTCGLVRPRTIARGIEICEGNRCAPLAADQTAIVCDRSAIYSFYAFSRQWRDHQRGIRENLLTNDWTAALVVAEMDVFAPKFVEWVRAEQPEPDVLFRDAAMATFLVAHEVAHTLEGDALPAPHEPERRFERMLLPATGQRIACRNFQQFARDNPRIFGRWITDTAEIDTMSGPGGKASFAHTRAIWDSELAADAYAVAAVRRLMDVAAHEMDAREALLCANEAFMTMSVMSWYRDLSRFAQVFCQPFAGRDYFLTHCLCGDDERRAAQQLLEDTHPPIPLRMMQAARQLMAGQRFETWPRELGMANDETGSLLYIVNHEAMIIAFNSCEKKEYVTTYPELSAAKVTDARAFEGEINFSEGGSKALGECAKRKTGH
jgi:hypothetical protein